MTSRYPMKPQVVTIGERMNIFIGGSYKQLTLQEARPFVRACQSELAALNKAIKIRRRAERKAMKESTP